MLSPFESLFACVSSVMWCLYGRRGWGWTVLWWCSWQSLFTCLRVSMAVRLLRFGCGPQRRFFFPLLVLASYGFCVRDGFWRFAAPTEMKRRNKENRNIYIYTYISPSLSLPLSLSSLTRREKSMYELKGCPGTDFYSALYFKFSIPVLSSTPCPAAIFIHFIYALFL